MLRTYSLNGLNELLSTSFNSPLADFYETPYTTHGMVRKLLTHYLLTYLLT
jgi:hypothetical protein